MPSNQEGRFICSTISAKNGTDLKIGYDNNDWSHRKELEFYSDYNYSQAAPKDEEPKDTVRTERSFSFEDKPGTNILF